jgi:translocation and assembly module TamB
MKFTRKTIWTAVGSAAILFGILAVALVYVLQSAWFRDQIRQRLIAQVEKATGGRVEIAGFDYDWHKLTGDLQGFVIHGTEPSDAAPLLRVETARVTVRIISLLERSADVSSIVLTRPQVNLIVAPDGATNIPTPRIPRTRSKTAIQELFALKLNHCEIKDGLLTASDKRVPLNFRGEGMDMVVTYRKAEPAYEITFSSRQVDFGLRAVRFPRYSLSARAKLNRDRVTVQSAELTSGESRITGSGTVASFAHPRVDFQVEANAPVDEFEPLIPLTNLRGGTAAIRGVGRFDETNGWSFSGKAEAREAGYYSQEVTLKGINAAADVEASRAGLSLRHLTASALGAKLVGEATIKNYRSLSLEGTISELTLRKAGSFFTDKSLAWQGVASGRVRATGTLAARAKDFAVQAELVISPGSGGIPVSGLVQLSFLRSTNMVEFGQTHLNFPHSNVSFSGSLSGQTQLVVDSSNLEDLRPVLDLIGFEARPDAWPVLIENGLAHFDGSISDLLDNPKFEGRLEASNARLLGETINEAEAKFSASGNGIDFASLNVRQGDTGVNGTGLLGFDHWLVNADSPVRAAIALRRVNVSNVVARFSKVELPIIQGIASGSLELRGTVGHLEGKAHIASDSLDAYGERLNQVRFDAEAAGEQLRISNGRVVSGAAVLSFSGDYQHLRDTWTNGLARIKVDSNGFPLGSLSPVRKYEPKLNAQTEIHLEASVRFAAGKFEPAGANGTVDFRNITLNKVPYGNLTMRSATRGQKLEASISGDLGDNVLHGSAMIDLTGENETDAEIDLDHVTVNSIYALTGVESAPLFDGSLSAKVRLEGALQKPELMRATLTADQLQLSSKLNTDTINDTNTPAVSLHNSGPLVLEAANGMLRVQSFRIEGDNTGLVVSGTVPYQDRKPMDLKVTGAVNLQVFHLFDPNVNSSGVSVISAAIGGTIGDPSVNGTLGIEDGSFFLANVPNGLSGVNGTVTFNRNRATLQKMTARSGGGQLTLGGFVSFGGGPLVYHLEAAADNVRVRYAGSISVTASSTLRLSGTSSSSLLAGTLTVSRVVFNPNTDVGNLLAGLGAAAATPTNENDFLTGLHLDVVIESAPNMQLSTSLSRDVEAEINLRVRGTPEHPIVLGNLAANQGDIQAFGARYTINRGEISFVNPVKIEPALDLDLETRARGVTIDITISGALNKLNISYRSDPPLQPREIIALLAVGRAPESTTGTANLRTNDINALQSGANSLLGAAVSSPVTNRLSRLFGVTNIRFDPLVEGLTNTPQARVTLEQQISRDVTVTYITNLSQTSEQIFRVEWAFSRQFSVIALRDDNGEFGIDFQYKRTFK